MSRSFIVAGHLADFVFQAADGVLHLAFGFLRRALAFHLLVAERLAGGFLDGAARLLARAFDTVLIHVFISLSFVVSGRWGANLAALWRLRDLNATWTEA